LIGCSTVRYPLEYEIRLKELNTIKAFSRRTKPELALKEAKDLIDVINNPQDNQK